MKKLIIILYSFSICWLSVLVQAKPSANDVQNLHIDFKDIIPDLLTNRVSRQFKDALMSRENEEVNSDAGIAMSLIDALQKWADALEAQISMMRGEVLSLKTSNMELSEEVTMLRTKNDELKGMVNNLDSDYAGFKGETAEDFKTMSTSMTEFLNHFDSFSESTRTNFTRLNEKYNSLDKKVQSSEMKMAEVLANNKALSANVQAVMYNASVALFNDMEDLRNHDESFTLQLKELIVSYDKLNDKYDVMANETIAIKDEVLVSLESIKYEVQASHELTISSMGPMMKQFNETFSASIGKLEGNVTILATSQDKLTSEVMTLNSMMASQMSNIQTQANVTISVQDDLVTLANEVNNLQGKFNGSMTTMETQMKQNHEVSVYNSTLLQRGFFSLERHFIEMKRKIFETQLNVVSVNSSLQIIGDLRTEVLTIGQAMANTTTLITDQFHEVHMKTNALQESYNMMWNSTNSLSDKLSRLHANHTYVSGNVADTIAELVDKIGNVDQAVDKVANRTALTETGLSELVNYAFSIDHRVTDLNGNMTKVNATFLDLFDRNIRKVFELHELQGQRIMENSNMIKSNVTQLSLAANIFETELSKVASAYTSLKNALGRTISSTGTIEANVAKLATENIQGM